MVFLLTPDGLQLHHITDGRFEGTWAAPANQLPLLAVAGPPLNNNAWNQVQPRLTGDTLNLSVNGTHFHSQILATDHSRHFGLFYYSDVSEARIRKIRWRGSWLKTLPAIPEQELCNAPSQPITSAMKDVPIVLDHDFSNGLPRDTFAVMNGGLGTDIIEQTDGVRVTRNGGEGQLRYGLGPRMQLGGNFEITATFEQLQTSPSANGNCNVHLALELPDDFHNLYRGDHESDRQLWSATFRRRDGGAQIDFPVQTAEEATSGRLRMTRLGNQLHYLFAEQASENFRLIDTQEISNEATIRNGIRLVVETEKPGRCSILWKRLTIRADSVAGRDVPIPDMTVQDLDRQRSKLLVQKVFDFTKQKPSTDEFVVLGDVRFIDAQPLGFELISLGSESWTTFGLTSKTLLHGDFDVFLDLLPKMMDRPRDGDDTAVILQTELQDDKRSTVEIKHSLNSEGLHMQIVRRIDNAEGEFSFQIVNTAPVTTVRSLRIARRGEFAWMLYREQPSTAWKILGGVSVGTADVPPTFLRMHLHTGGEKRESRVWLQRLSIATNPAPVQLRLSR